MLRCRQTQCCFDDWGSGPDSKCGLDCGGPGLCKEGHFARPVAIEERSMRLCHATVDLAQKTMVR
eukprot:3816165-Amphidinium_carterae.1